MKKARATMAQAFPNSLVSGSDFFDQLGNGVEKVCD